MPLCRAVDAQSHRRINIESTGGNGLLAFFAKSEFSVLDASKRRVDIHKVLAVALGDGDSHGLAL